MLTIKSSTIVVNPEPEKSIVSGLHFPFLLRKGAVFGLLRFAGKKTITKELLGETIEERLSRFSQTIEGNVHMGRRFEQLLHAINEDIVHILSENQSFPLSDAQMCIGLVDEDKLYLSGVGDLSALFMHHTAKQRYVLYELSDQFADSHTSSWDKPFETVLDGELHEGDIFYLATRVSARQITLAELQDILTTLPPSGAVKRISQYLNRDTIYASIAMKLQDRLDGGPPKKTNPMQSVAELNRTHESTTHLLGDQSPQIGHALSKLTAPLIKKLSTPGKRGYSYLFKRILKLLIQITTLILGWFLRALSLLCTYTYRIAKHTPILVRHGRDFAKETQTLKQHVHNWKDRLQSISKATKYTGASIFLLVIILIGSLVIQQRNAAQQEQETTFNAIVEHIEEKIHASEASLIYNNEEQAQRHLQEASALLATLQITSRTQENKAQDLKESLQVLVYDIQKMTPVEFNIVNEFQESQSIGFHQIDGTIYALSAQADLYRYNGIENTWQAIPVSIGAIGEISHSNTTQDGNLLVVDTDQQLGLLNIKNQTLQPIVSGAPELLSVEGIEEYNESVYLLTAQGQQILKMRKRGSGYEAGTPWISSLNSNTSLTNARDLSIDGNIYILTDTRIVSFLSGREQSFQQSTISPKIEDPTQMWTSSESKYLYILEPKHTRVIVYNKEGDLVAQYVNEAIESAQNFIIDEKEKQIYILTENALSRFSASHLMQ